jgi:hypothetical protein
MDRNEGSPGTFLASAIGQRPNGGDPFTKGSSTAGGLGCRCPLVMRLRSEFEEKGDVPEIVGSYSSENKKGGSFYGLSERKRKREGGAGRKGCGLTAYATSD